MDSILTRLNRARIIAGRTFGVHFRPWIVGWVFLNLRLAVGFARLLDPIFFPGFRKVEIKAPIILVGNPRTGTTFLQRFLTDHNIGCSMELYRMVYPSLLLQTVLKPLLPVLEAVSPAKYHKPEVHETSLSKVETDDAAMISRYFDGFFVYGFFLAFDQDDLLPQFDPKVRDTSVRDFDWLYGLWQRNLYAHKADRVVAKLFSLAPRLPQFLKRYPDARILYMARDPLEIFPSGMSLVTGVLDEAFGFWKLPDATKQQWFDRLYAGFVLLLQRFHDDWQSGAIPRESVYIVRYDRMMAEFDTVMGEMLPFLGHEPDEKLRADIEKLAAKQRAYKSKHKYDLAKFNLDADRIKKDCKFFYDTFLPGYLENLEKAEG
ncbi:sulfotransferase [Myxococcota bacterium]|nr:sulfotransferase [Myxococcota bacterium]